MRPALFYIGSIPIWSYGTFIALGMLTLFAMALVSARRDRRSWEQLLPVAMGVMAGGVFGGCLSHLLVEPGMEADVFSSFLPERVSSFARMGRAAGSMITMTKSPGSCRTCTQEQAARELFALPDRPGGHGDRIAIVILCEAGYSEMIYNFDSRISCPCPTRNHPDED